MTSSATIEPPALRRARAISLAVASAVQLFLVACSGGGGSGGAPPSIQAPSVAYPSGEVDLLRGVAMAALAPASTGGIPDEYTVKPKLPKGVELDATTGRITGLPTKATDLATYTVTARNEGGEDQFEIAIRVLASFDHTRFAYAANFQDGSISRYVVDDASGTLRPNGLTMVGLKPLDATIYPTGEFLYVSNFGDASITVFGIDSLSGDLEEIQTIATGQSPAGTAIDPTGRFFYVALHGNNAVTGFSIERETGRLTALDSVVPAGGPAQLAISDDGRFLYATFFNSNAVGIYGLDPATGEFSIIDLAETGSGPIGLGLSPNGDTLLVANFDSDNVSAFSRDAATGALTLAGTTPAGNGSAGLEVDSRGRAWVSNFVESTISIFDLSGGANAVTSVGKVAVGSAPLIVRARPAGDMVYATNLRANEISRIDDSKPSPIPGAELLLPAEQTRSRLGPSGLALAFGPTPVTFEPLFVYTANRGTNDVTTLSVHSGSGFLTDLGEPLATGAGPVSLAVRRNNESLYVANRDSGTVSSFALDVVTGVPTPLGPELQSSSANDSLAIEGTGRYLYAFGDNGAFAFDIDAETGELTGGEVATDNEGVGLLVVEPTGTFTLVVDREGKAVNAFAISNNTGELSLSAVTSVFGEDAFEPSAASIHPSGRFLFVADQIANDIEVYLLDSIDGGLLFLGSEPCGDGPRDIVSHPLGRWLFTANAEGRSITQLAIDPLDGLLTRVADVPTAGMPAAICADPSGRFLYVADDEGNTLESFAVDPETGELAALERIPLAVGTAPSDVHATGRLVLTKPGQ